MNFDKYVNFDKLVKDFNLISGDISPNDIFKLNDIIERFINTNKTQ
jgi:hypothetical protein